MLIDFYKILAYEGYISGYIREISEKKPDRKPGFTVRQSNNVTIGRTQKKGSVVLHFTELLGNTADFFGKVRGGGFFLWELIEEVLTDAVGLLDGVGVDFVDHGEDGIKPGNGIVPQLLSGIPDGGCLSIGRGKNFVRLLPRGG